MEMSATREIRTGRGRTELRKERGQPWRTETFKVSPNPLLTGKIRDVAGLCLAPPANGVVFSVAESCRPRLAADRPGAADESRGA